MNRPIKFRFWGNFGELNEEEDICEMEMLYGDKFCFFESEPINDLFACRNFQVMQFTGLKDKNGVDIYEGDILYIAGQGKVIVKFPFFDLYERVYCGDSDDIENIIGNIYEHKFLLDKKLK
jgi:hypothetical protein